MSRAGAAAMLGARRGRTFDPLMDYANLSLTRALEAAAWDFRIGAFYDLVTPWPGVNVARVLPDGSVLIEGQRKNAMPDSDDMSDPPKDHLNSPTITDDDGTAPDGTGMDLITYAAGGAAGQIRDLLDDTLFTDGLNCQFSVFLQGDGADQLRVFMRDKALATALDQTIQPSASIGRIVRTVPQGSGSADPLVGLIEVTDNAPFYAWGWQIEPNADFPTSPIRTSGAVVTRPADVGTMANADVDSRFFTEGFEVDFWPQWDAGSGPSAASLLDDTSGSNHLRFANDTTLRVRANGANSNIDVTGDFVRGDKLTIRVDFLSGNWEVFVNGVSVGSDTLANDWSTGSSNDVQIGHGTTVGANPAFGIISQPRAI